MFVIPAYKVSPYLEKCILSLKRQTVQSRICISTSTPCEFLTSIANRYDIPLFYNSEDKGIASDWSYALNIAETDFVTLAHQDDIYMPRYVESCLHAANKSATLIVFTDYIENVESRIRKNNLLLLVKRLMIKPFFLLKPSIGSSFLKKLLISFGNPISCPTVMYNKHLIGEFDFNKEFSMNLDWEANFRFSNMRGDFVYVGKKLVIRRIHRGSESTNAIKNYRRHYEDRLIFEKLWPRLLAKILLKLYAIGYKSNRTDNCDEQAKNI